MMNGYDMNGWGWIGMTMMVVVTLTLVGLFVWATTARRSREPQDRAASAFTQLDVQLATGKIDAREHRERLEALRENHSRA